MDAGSRGALITVVRTSGSTYRRAGARAVIAQHGVIAGAVSGGCLERDLAIRIRPWLSDFTARVVTYDAHRDDDRVFGTGLGCRGIIDLLVEPFDHAHPPRLVKEFRWNGRQAVEWTTTLPNGETLIEIIRPPRSIVIFGSGNDVEPLTRLAGVIGWNADVVTTRDPVDLTNYDAAVVMTHNFERDIEIATLLNSSPLAYIGILGPKSRGDEILAAIGASPRDARFHSPIGLDIGGETPSEIALSIIAEIQSVLELRSARPLREINSPIHEAIDIPKCV